MINIFSSTYKITAVALGFMLCSQISLAAQNPVPITTPKPSLSMSEDPAKWRRDPFITNVKNGAGMTGSKSIPLKMLTGLTKKEQEPDIELQGIMQTDNSFHALINGRNVKAGDKIAGITIKEISRFKVVTLNELKEKITYDIYQGRIDRGKK